MGDGAVGGGGADGGDGRRGPEGRVLLDGVGRGQGAEAAAEEGERAHRERRGGGGGVGTEGESGRHRGRGDGGHYDGLGRGSESECWTGEWRRWEAPAKKAGQRIKGSCALAAVLWASLVDASKADKKKYCYMGAQNLMNWS